MILLGTIWTIGKQVSAKAIVVPAKRTAGDSRDRFGEHDNDGDYALGDLAAIRARPHHVSRDFEGFNHR